MIWLKIVTHNRVRDLNQVQPAIAECDKLIAISVRSTKQPQKKSAKKPTISNRRPPATSLCHA